MNFHTTKLRKYNNYGRGWSFELFLKVHIINAIEIPMIECNKGRSMNQKYFTYNNNYYKVNEQFIVDQIHFNEIPMSIQLLLTPNNE